MKRASHIIRVSPLPAKYFCWTAMRFFFHIGVVGWAIALLLVSFLGYCDGLAPRSAFLRGRPFTRETTTQTKIGRLKAVDTVGECFFPCFGGTLKKLETEEEDGFLTQLSVPTFAVQQLSTDCSSNEEEEEHCDNRITSKTASATRLGLEALVPGAFVLKNALCPDACQDILRICESIRGFETYRAGKNNHGAMQIVVSQGMADEVCKCLSRHVNLGCLHELSSHDGTDPEDDSTRSLRHAVWGINRRWRVYRYEPGGAQTFAPHIDSGFAPSGLSPDGSTLIWDNTPTQLPPETTVVSRFTVLMYLNDDFVGGNTNFYRPLCQQETASSEKMELIASVKPEAGSILVFPQAVGEKNVQHARTHWPLHEGSPVFRGNRPKYVIRSDIIVETTPCTIQGDRESPMFRYDNDVRFAFMPQSPVFDSAFLSQVSSLYNPHMGVENLGIFLYSFVRFTKIRSIVEIGAGYTTLWLLQALDDNRKEFARISTLEDRSACRLLDYPWTVPEDTSLSASSRLLCIDDCLHQRQSATSAASVAKFLGIDHYLEFRQGDAFDLSLEPESVDLLWCDFGVGARMREFAPRAWKSIRPGGFLVCHSTLTNRGTREWLEEARQGRTEAFGVPSEEFVELSLLEPHKRYQNSISIFQRRQGPGGTYSEPLFSEYA